MKGEKLPMRTNQKSSFAAGLLVATVICGAVYFLEPSETSIIPTVEVPTETEMKDTLVASGYVVFTEEEWNEQLAAVEATSKQDGKTEPEETAQTEESSEPEEEVAYRTILNVESGMTSIDVGRVLVLANITDSAMSFVQEVEKRGISNNLRPGSYEISSDMTFDEVISIVFK
jgi:hypothetical protein